MKVSRTRRVLTAMCVTAAACGIPVMAAAPAQATPTACMQYLHDVGYVVGPRAKQACRYGDDLTQKIFCLPVLLNIGVSQRHASTACDLADRA